MGIVKSGFVARIVLFAANAIFLRLPESRWLVLFSYAVVVICVVVIIGIVHVDVVIVVDVVLILVAVILLRVVCNAKRVAKCIIRYWKTITQKLFVSRRFKAKNNHLDNDTSFDTKCSASLREVGKVQVSKTMDVFNSV